MNPQARPSADPERGGRFMLWIDGVGAYLLSLRSELTIGGPALAAGSADVSLLANLSRRHASLIRSREGYILEAHAATRVCGRAVPERTHLADGYDIELGRGVRLRFRIPSVLSSTAVLEFVSVHRPQDRVDGIILMEENCLLGPRNDNHVNCPEWSEPVLLYRTGGEFRCRASTPVFIDGDLSRTGGPVSPGSVVAGEDFRFRIEAID